MKLLIDARPLQNAHRTRGVGVLLQNLLPAMGRLAEDDEATLITLKGRSLPQLFPREKRLETFRLERPNRFNWIADHLLLPGIARRSGAEVFFATDFNSYLIPTWGVRVVSIAYDLIPFIFPESMAAQPLPVKVGWRINFPKLVASDGVAAISEATKEDVVRLFDADPQRISVIYPGIDHGLFNAANALDGRSQGEVVARYGIRGDYVLYVGDSEWRKNLRRVLEAMAAIRDDVSIVLVGKKALTDPLLRRWIGELGLERRTVLTGFVPDADLPALYGAARAFVFPSIYEGFGFPIAEAMACGCPVITSRISSMPEVAGDAALLVNPESVAEIRDALESLLAEDSPRQRLTAAGLRQAAQFSWQRCATETLALLRSVAGRRGER